MTDLNFNEFDEILRKLSRDRNPVEAMVEATLMDEGDDLVSIAHSCSVPRMFGVDIIAAFLRSDLSEADAYVLAKKMREWEFVQEFGRDEYSYRQEAREYLRTKLQRDNADRFDSLNKLSYRYFVSKLPTGWDVEEKTWLNFSASQLDALREAIYHLLQYDPERGFVLFRRMFERSIQLHLVEESFSLTKFLRQIDTSRFSLEHRLELEYFDAVQCRLDGRVSVAEEKLLGIVARDPSPELKAKSLTELGKLYYRSRKFDPAIENFLVARRIWLDSKSLRQSAALSNNIGQIYLEKKDYKQAERLFLDAMKILEQLGASSELVKTLNNLGNLYRMQDEWDNARSFYERSLQIKNSMGDRYGAAVTHLNIGRLHQRLAQDAQNGKQEAKHRLQAKNHFSQSLNTFRQFGARTNLAFTLYSLAVLFYQEGQPGQARQSANESIEIFSALGMQDEMEMAKKFANRLV